uniref:Uncharacterized protein n=1 Tax=Anguilla anguilla TaxID=7936 RepID=A0A0E9XVK8_ANGAN
MASWKISLGCKPL